MPPRSRNAIRRSGPQKNFRHQLFNEVIEHPCFEAWLAQKGINQADFELGYNGTGELKKIRKWCDETWQIVQQLTADPARLQRYLAMHNLLETTDVSEWTRAQLEEALEEIQDI